MTRVLKMIFENTRTGKTATWTLSDPASTITQMSVATVMNNMIVNEVIIVDTDTGTNLEIKDAYIYTTEKIELE